MQEPQGRLEREEAVHTEEDDGVPHQQVPHHFEELDPRQVGRLPRLGGEELAHVHDLKAARAGLLLAHQRPATDAEFVKRMLARELNGPLGRARLFLVSGDAGQRGVMQCVSVRERSMRSMSW